MCPSGWSGWERGAIHDIAAEIWEGLIDRSPWENVEAFADYVDASVDRNDDVACITTRWGTRPAERAHWYGVPFFLVVDNTAGGRPFAAFPGRRPAPH